MSEDTTAPNDELDDGELQDEGEPFVAHPTWLLLHDKLSDAGYRLYGALKLHARQSGKAYPKRTTLAEELAWSLDKVDRAKKQLIEVGALEVVRRWRQTDRTKPDYDRIYLTPGPKGSTIVPTSNLYRLRWADPEAPRGGRSSAATPSRKSAATPGRKDAATPAPAPSRKSAATPSRRTAATRSRKSAAGVAAELRPEVHAVEVEGTTPPPPTPSAAVPPTQPPTTQQKEEITARQDETDAPYVAEAQQLIAALATEYRLGPNQQLQLIGAAAEALESWRPDDLRQHLASNPGEQPTFGLLRWRLNPGNLPPPKRRRDALTGAVGGGSERGPGRLSVEEMIAAADAAEAERQAAVNGCQVCDQYGKTVDGLPCSHDPEREAGRLAAPRAARTVATGRGLA